MIGAMMGASGGLSASGGSAGPSSAETGPQTVGGDYYNFTTTGLNLGEIIKSATEGNSMTGGTDAAVSSLAGFVTRDGGVSSKLKIEADSNLGLIAVGGAVLIAFFMFKRKRGF